MKVGLLTVSQKDQIFKKINLPNSYFNPIQDKNGNWVISLEEIEACTSPDFNWVKDLPLIDYVEKPVIAE
jgi:hypothetical protein